MLGFSSTQITSAFSGGFRYNPTMSAALATKLRVGADAPGALTLETDAFVAQHAPNRMHRPSHGTGHRGPVPGRLAGRGRLLQQRQDSLPKGVVVPPLGSRSRHVAQPLQTLADKALPPFDYGVGASVTLAGNLPDPFAGETAHDNPGTFYHLFGFGPTPGEALQFSPVVRTTTDCGRSPSHAPRYIIYRLAVQLSTSESVARL